MIWLKTSEGELMCVGTQRDHASCYGFRFAVPGTVSIAKRRLHVLAGLVIAGHEAAVNPANQDRKDVCASTVPLYNSREFRRSLDLAHNGIMSAMTMEAFAKMKRRRSSHLGANRG